MSTKKILFKNTIISFLSQFLLMGIGIITTPYVVHKLGDSEYGIISIVMVFVGYLSFLDLGIGWAIIKFVAEYKAHENTDEIRKILQTSESVFLAGGLLVIIIISFFGKYLVLNVFNIPEHLEGVSIVAFQVASIGFLINMLATVYGSVLLGYQRFDITNLIRVIYGIINIMGTVILLYFGFGLLGVIIWNFLVTILNFILVFVFAKRVEPQISMQPVFYKKTFKEIISFSFFSTLSKIGVQMIYNLEKAFVSAFLPIKMLTYYIIPFNVASKLTVVCSTLGSVIYPAFSAFDAANEREKVKNLFLIAQKYIFIGVYPLVYVLFFFADVLLKYWMGEEYALLGTVPLRVLSFAFLLNSITSEDAILFDGIGMPKISAIIVTISGLLNLPLVYILVKLKGIEGASFALLISITIYGAGLMLSTKKILGINILQRFKFFVVPVLVSLMVLPVSYYLSSYIKGISSLVFVLSLNLFLLYLFLFLVCFTKNEKKELIDNLLRVIGIKRSVMV